MLRLAFGLILLFLLPGFAIVYAIYPRKGDLDLQYDNIYRFFLSVGFSVVAVIISGFILNMFGVKDDGTGYFTSFNIIAFLLAITVIGLLVAWFRGAFPLLAKVHPKLYRNPERKRYDMGGGETFLTLEEREEIEALAKERKKLNDRMTSLKRRPHNKENRREMDEVIEKLASINERSERLENKRKGAL